MGLPEQIVTNEAMEAITRYPFHENVRELENMLERTITFCEENTITADDLQLPHSEAITQFEEDSNQLEQIGLDNYLAKVEKRSSWMLSQKADLIKLLLPKNWESHSDLSDTEFKGW